MSGEQIHVVHVQVIVEGESRYFNVTEGDAVGVSDPEGPVLEVKVLGVTHGKRAAGTPEKHPDAPPYVPPFRATEAEE